MSFKEVLRELMDRQKLSQTKLANASGVPRETIRGWSKRNSAPREWEPIVDIGFALGCDGTDMNRLLHAAGHPRLDVLAQMCAKALQDAQKREDEFGEYDYQERLSWIEKWSKEATNGALGGGTDAVDTTVREESHSESGIVEQVAGVSPYMGLSAFEEKDSDLFFGREKLAAEVAHRLCSLSFLALIGASGSGKSSLVRAGLIPLLKSGKSEFEGRALPPNCDQWAIEIITPKSKPLSELAASLTRDQPYQEQVELEANMQAQSNSFAGYVRRYLHRHEADRLLLVVDQFEELFTHQSADPSVDADGVDHALFQNNVEGNNTGPTVRERIGEQQAFIDNILTAAQNSDRVIVLLTVRADFYSRILDFPMLRAVLPEQQINIGPMGEDELRSAIEEPAKLSGWEFEPLLVDEILEDMATERGTLPLLSHALFETWERRRGKTLTRQGYRSAGRIQGAIAHTAEQFYTSLSSDEKALARSIFIRMTSLGEGTEDTRRRVNLNELRKLRPDVQQTNRVIAQLADARLITTDRDDLSKREQADIAHEALIKNWQRLEEWLRDGREGLRIHRRLTDTATEWQATNCEDASLLYTGTQLELAENWQIDHLDELNELEKTFLAASITERDKRDAEKERIQRERDEAKERELLGAQKARNRALLAMAAAFTALLLLIGMGAYFYNEYQQSIPITRAQELIAEAKVLKTELKGTEALEQLQEAQSLHKDALPDFELEEEQIRRYVANGLTAQGEALLRTARDANDSELWNTNYFSATALFNQALSLEPPVDTLVYVKVPSGDFQMGEGRSVQTIQVNEFWMMRTEATKEQYKRCANAGKCTRPNDSRFEDNRFQLDPVIGVTREQANEYASWVGGRLPTETEWEYACRGTDGRTYPWGNEEPTIRLLNYKENPGDSTSSVGSYLEGASPYGLYDMAGNAQEWVTDGFQQDDVTYSLRGGSYSLRSDFVRCVQSFPDDRSHTLSDAGFRVVVDILSSGF